MMVRASFWLGLTVAFFVAFALTQAVGNEYIFFAGFVVLQFVVLATAWNVLGGYCGYINFGTPAFVALGAYTAVFLGKWQGAPLGVQILAGAAMAGGLGLAVGLMTLRLKGIFFAIATVAVSVILETVLLNWPYLGGARGAMVVRPMEAPLVGTYTRLLFLVMSAIALAAVAVARTIERSAFGRALNAIRDDELAAECAGVPTLRLKLVAATVSGALMGAAGAPLPAYLNYIDPSSAFSLNYAVSALAMPMIGGTQHWAGPVLGAILLGVLQQAATVTVASELNVLIVGVLLIVAVVAAPRGLVGLVGEARDRWRRRAAS